MKRESLFQEYESELILLPGTNNTNMFESSYWKKVIVYLALERLRFAVPEVVFIDDTQKHVTATKALGIQLVFSPLLKY